jgi:hypothetical protein
MALKLPVGMGWVVMGEGLKVFGPHFGNLQNWMKKIKKSFDPNVVIDPVGYVSAEDK